MCISGTRFWSSDCLRRPPLLPSFLTALAWMLPSECTLSSEWTPQTLPLKPQRCILLPLWLHRPHVPRSHPGCWIGFSFPAFVCFPGPTGGSAPSLTPCSSSSMMKSVSWSSDAAQEVSPPSALLLSSLVFLHSCFSYGCSNASKSHLYVLLNKALR